MVIKYIQSGYQTGADIAAIDSAVFLNIDYGGWVPKGAFNERGKLVDINYKETPSGGYLERTMFNVRDSDATLIFSYGKVTGGSYRTMEYCKQYNKPHLYIDLTKLKTNNPITKWLKEHKPTILNVAGSRESKHPGIYKVVRYTLIEVLIQHNGIKI